MPKYVHFWILPRNAVIQSPARAEGGSVAVASSSAATRYDSDAHAPRSISLQRSEQNGRAVLRSVHSTFVPHVGQLTMRLITRSTPA